MSRFFNPNQGNSFGPFPKSFNPSMQIVEPTYPQHIIQPPELNITTGRIPKRYVVDSCQRDCSKYPRTNEFVIDLEHDLRDVISIELIKGCLPYTGYIINENNNKLFFQETLGMTLVAEIPVGDYTPNELATALESAMNSAFGVSSNYTVTDNTATRKFTISSDLSGGDNIFRLIFNDCECGLEPDCDTCEVCRKNTCRKYIQGSLGPKIGFDKVNFLYAKGVITGVSDLGGNVLEIMGCETKFLEEFTVGEKISFVDIPRVLYDITSILDNETMEITASSADDANDALSEIEGSRIYANKFTGQYVWDVEDEKYVIIEFRDAERLESNTKSIDNGFSLIYFDTEHGNNAVFRASTNKTSETKYYNPPLGKLKQIRLRFLTKEGYLYDFNGRNVTLEFEIITLNSPGKYNTLLTT